MQYLETNAYLWNQHNLSRLLAVPMGGAKLHEGDSLLNVAGDPIGSVMKVLEDGTVRMRIDWRSRELWKLRGQILRFELVMLVERQHIRLRPGIDRAQFLRSKADELALLVQRPSTRWKRCTRPPKPVAAT